MSENLIAEIFGILVTVLLVDFLLKRREKREAQRRWKPLRLQFCHKISDAIEHLIKAFDYIEGWGPFYTEGWIREGPKVFAGRIDERCKKAMSLRVKYADRGDNQIKERYSKEEEILRRIYSERVLKKNTIT